MIGGIRARHLPLILTVLIFCLGYGACVAQYPAFASFRVIGDLFTDNSFLGILAVGMTFVRQ